MEDRGWKMAILAWFIFSLSGSSVVEEARLVSSRAYPTAESCVDAARLLQGPNLTPFFYCVGSEAVSELPPLREQTLRFSIDGGGNLR